MKYLIAIGFLLFLWGGCNTASNQDQPEDWCGTEDADPEINKTSLNDSLYGIGKQLFLENCAACHRPNTKIIGIPFQRIREDYGEEWVLKFVKNNEALQKQGDVRALYVFKFWKSPMMPRFEHLSDNQIRLILDYVDSFEYVEIRNGRNYYEHRKLSVNAMKDSLKQKEAGYK